MTKKVQVNKFKRPLPEGHENVKTKENFELRYLRWDYLVRAANPTNDELKKFEKSIRYIARTYYKKYQYEFSSSGNQVEDVENVARVHAVSYLGLYSLKSNPNKLKAFKERLVKEGFDPEDETHIDRKENLSLMSFLQQRLEEFALTIRRKFDEEPGMSTMKVFQQVIPGQWPSDEELYEDPASFGWKILSRKAFLALPIRSQYLSPGLSFCIDGKVYRTCSFDTKVYSNFKRKNSHHESHHHEYGETLGQERIFTITPLVLDDRVLYSNSSSAEDLMIRAEEDGIKVKTFNGLSVEVTRRDRIERVIDRYKNLKDDRKIKLIDRLITILSKKNDEENLVLARKIRHNLKVKVRKGAVKDGSKVYKDLDKSVGDQ
jgi:hypothetical protein